MEGTKLFLLTTFLKASRKTSIACAIIAFVILSLTFIHPSVHSSLNLPKIRLEYGKHSTVASSYNASKVALLIENRPDPILAPLILHFISVVPPDWRFRFMGSNESVQKVNSSRAIRDYVSAGKLDLTYIPDNVTITSQEHISRFLTSLWLYETVLQPAEWLLVFQTDSMLCANSRQSLNSWLDYDWVGAPWNPKSEFGGNGGLSLRRVSSIVEVLRNQERIPGATNEDVWLTERLGYLPGAKLANGTVSLAFSAEQYPGELEHVGSGEDTGNPSKAGELIRGIDDWRDGFYEPMGYHTGHGGEWLNPLIWGKPALREHIWNYCPEMKMTLKMDVANYMVGECNAEWKRGEESERESEMSDVEDPLAPTEIIMPW